MHPIQPRSSPYAYAGTGPQRRAPAVPTGSPIHMRPRRQHVAIIGGGTAGTATAAALARGVPGIDITLIDPARTHYYQPGFTLVAGGVFTPEQVARAQHEQMPAGVHWRQQYVARIEAAAHRLVLDDGTTIHYDYLIVAPGLELDWDAVPGLRAALGDGRVCSMYYAEGARDTWERINAFRGGRALFTMPPMPIKCPGAPQKIVYLAGDLWRRRRLLGQTDIGFRLATDSLFSVAEYVPTLEGVARRYGVNLSCRTRLVRIDAGAREAEFVRTESDGSTTTWREPYDLLHAVPPQRAPAVVRDGPLADATGWVGVDPETLRHREFGNVFALGDAAGLPTSKTAAAIRAQVPVLVANLRAAIAGEELPLRYSGYASCPLITGYGRVVLAEFVYGRKVTPSLPWDSTRERRSAWWLKTRFLPWMYWQRLLRGVDLPLLSRH